MNDNLYCPRPKSRPTFTDIYGDFGKTRDPQTCSHIVSYTYGSPVSEQDEPIVTDDTGSHSF